MGVREIGLSFWTRGGFSFGIGTTSAFFQQTDTSGGGPEAGKYAGKSSSIKGGDCCEADAKCLLISFATSLHPLGDAGSTPDVCVAFGKGFLTIGDKGFKNFIPRVVRNPGPEFPDVRVSHGSDYFCAATVVGAPLFSSQYDTIVVTPSDRGR
ncbi:hypothetical protein Bbelb_402330 [Branchiostoma belcheri]|nr:hypothetical protein Bbelb_402330 [Branchiostoma belcheri]